MRIISLIAAPGGLEPALVSALQTAFGGGAARWLSPDEAAEFPVRQRPANLDEVRETLSARGVDVNDLPAEGREKRLLLADMDSTMIGQECIDELAVEAGVGDRVARITARAMNGELDFEGALRERVALLAGLPETVIDRVLATRITETPGGRTLVATMKARGATTMLVSGGFTRFARPLAERIGFDRFRANRLVIRDGRLTGEVEPPILGREAKVEALEALCAELGLDASDALAVGDGANDLGMLGRAGMGVALHAKQSVAAEAPLRIDHGDLRALLFLQSMAANEFRDGGSA